jgi:CrcB protein
MNWLAVAVGGALGSLARHGVSQWLQVRSAEAKFPIGITVVNISGCVVIGLLAGLLASERLAWRPATREFVFVGLLGGFTTFSTFGLDTLLLARAGSAGSAALNVGLQVAGGLAGVWLGYQLGERGW